MTLEDVKKLRQRFTADMLTSSDIEHLLDDAEHFASLSAPAEEPWGNFEEAIEAACRRETLAEALTVLAVWESERVVKQARENPTWETFFEFLFKALLAAWGDRPLHAGAPSPQLTWEQLSGMFFETIGFEQMSKEQLMRWVYHKMRGETFTPVLPPRPAG